MIINDIVKWFKDSGQNSSVVRFTEDELETLTGMYASNIPISDIAAVMYKSEQRIRYEINKLKQKDSV